MPSPVNRRSFLTSCAVSAAGMATVVPAHVSAFDAPVDRWLTQFYTDDGGTLRDPQVRALTGRALEAARSAGAEYADVRVTYTRRRKISSNNDEEHGRAEIGFSVRALVRGYWGWAATSTLTDAEVVRVARTATANAQTLTKHGRDRVVEWVPLPTVRDGDWTTPIEVDPFTVPRREIATFLRGECGYAVLRPGVSWGRPSELAASFLKQDRVFASTEGSYGIQTIYETGCAGLLVNVGFGNAHGNAPLRSTGYVQAGWEYVRDQPWRPAIPVLLDEIAAEQRLPFEAPLEIGRYDVVFGADATASLVAATLGSATRLGRAIGTETNSLGTSYLGPHVLSVLGTRVASPLVSIIGNRSRPKALATVAWDDEGVSPEDFPLVTNGVLVDYLTTREQAPWLKEWYTKQGLAVRSRGCASSRDAHDVMREKTPNLEMRPGVRDQSFDDLIADLGTGVAIRNLNGVEMDWQCLNGLVVPTEMYRIRHGKRVARISPPETGTPNRNAVMFRAPELLNGILAIGGPRSQEWSTAINLDGSLYSIGAVPITVKQMTIVDPSRRA